MLYFDVFFFRLEAKKCPVVMVADVCADSNVRHVSKLPVCLTYVLRTIIFIIMSGSGLTVVVTHNDKSLILSYFVQFCIGNR